MLIKAVVLFSTFAHLAGSATHVLNPPQSFGYYWREFYGEIPLDAVPGGRDRAGNPTYIGQVYGRDLELLPATIVSGSPLATTTRGASAVQTDKNVKILCSNEQYKFKWIQTKIGDVHTLTNCHLVNGGSEVDHFLHIGRVNHQAEVIIGKVFSYRDDGGLAIPYGGLPVYYKAYQILAFDCH